MNRDRNETKKRNGTKKQENLLNFVTVLLPHKIPIENYFVDIEKEIEYIGN